MLNCILIATACYLIGSIPSGVIVGKLARGLDIRALGSGNTGTTNSFRVLGWKLGLVVAALDFGKGYLAVALLSRLAPFPGPSLPAAGLFIVSSLAVVLGHVKPAFAGFKGGKGFATAAGAITAAYPLLAPFCLAVFLVALAATGFVAVCAVATAAALPLLYLFLSPAMNAGTDQVILVYFIVLFFVTAFSVRRRMLELFTGRAERFDKAMLFKPKRKENDKP